MQAVVKKGSGWYQFKNPERVWKASSLEEIIPMLEEADEWARNEQGIIDC